MYTYPTVNIKWVTVHSKYCCLQFCHHGYHSSDSSDSLDWRDGYDGYDGYVGYGRYGGDGGDGGNGEYEGCDGYGSGAVSEDSAKLNESLF